MSVSIATSPGEEVARNQFGDFENLGEGDKVRQRCRVCDKGDKVTRVTRVNKSDMVKRVTRVRLVTR